MLPTIGERIKAIRVFRGMTQKELGLAIGLHGSSVGCRIAQYETGVREPKKETLEKFANALHVDRQMLDPLGNMEQCLYQLEKTAAETFMRQLLWMEETNANAIQTCLMITEYLRAWQAKRAELSAGRITDDEYFEWKIHFGVKEAKASYEQRQENHLYVRCFGSFEVFHNGRPIHFGRAKTKELFAYLIDRKGAFLSSETIAAVLWEDENDLASLRHRLRNLICDLRASLAEIGQENLIVRGRDRIGLDLGGIACDYYRFLSGEAQPQETFRGEYMEQYSWAEDTKGLLFSFGAGLTPCPQISQTKL